MVKGVVFWPVADFSGMMLASGELECLGIAMTWGSGCLWWGENYRFSQFSCVIVICGPDLSMWLGCEKILLCGPGPWNFTQVAELASFSLFLQTTAEQG